MKTPIAVIGSYVQDLTFYTQHFPKPGETLIGNFQTGPGGKGSNQAIAAARTNTPTCFIGAIGNDAFASVAQDFHKQEGVDARWLTLKKSSTGAASIVVNEEGQNEIVVALGACNSLTADAVKSRMPNEVSIVVTQLETLLEGSIEAMRCGKEKGATTVLNPAPMRDDFPRKILDYVDIFIPNETEFVRVMQIMHPETYKDISEINLSKWTEKELHTACRHLNLPCVILTLGERGAFVSTPNQYRLYPPLSNIKVVDTTGAGDAFVGGFAAGWVKFDGEIEKAVEYGIVVAGLSVTQKGTAPAMPEQTTIDQAFKKYCL